MLPSLAVPVHRSLPCPVTDTSSYLRVLRASLTVASRNEAALYFGRASTDPGTGHPGARSALPFDTSKSRNASNGTPRCRAQVEANQLVLDSMKSPTEECRLRRSHYAGVAWR